MPVDMGPRDAFMPDTGPGPCSGVHCTGFTHCVSGMCVDYPMCRGDGSCPTMGDVCVNRRCLPCTADPDGDGSGACVDCDETNAMVHPGATEICNSIDDNCNMMIDEGDTSAICAMEPAGGVCTMGMCVCPAGFLDLDRTASAPGCECQITPPQTSGPGSGDSCPNAVEIGPLADVRGVQQIVTGNALPTGREVWYHFTTSDTSYMMGCDHTHVHVSFVDNPGGAYDFMVVRGPCGSMQECSTDPTSDSLQEYERAFDTNVPDTTMGGVVTGMCPCDAMTDGINHCAPQEEAYYVRVRRHPGAPDACAPYQLRIANGPP